LAGKRSKKGRKGGGIKESGAKRLKARGTVLKKRKKERVLKIGWKEGKRTAVKYRKLEKDWGGGSVPSENQNGTENNPP